MAKNSCPTWLDIEAKKEWRRIIKILELEKVDFKEKDLKALEGYCMSYSKWKKCEQYLMENGYTFEAGNGYIQQRPEVAISNKAIQEMRAYQKELGLTPAARTRMNKNISENTTKSKAEEAMEELMS